MFLFYSIMLYKYLLLLFMCKALLKALKEIESWINVSSPKEESEKFSGELNSQTIMEQKTMLSKCAVNVA